MKKQILFILFTLAAVIHGNCQDENFVFSANYTHFDGTTMETRLLPFGDPNELFYKYPGKFTSISEAENHIYTGGYVAQYSHNVAYDDDGNLKFFIIDGNVYDHEGVLLGESIKNTSDLAEDWIPLGLPEGNSETLIIRNTADCNKYIVIAASFPEGHDLGNGMLFYSFEIDFNTPHDFYGDRYGLITQVTPQFNISDDQGGGSECQDLHLALSTPNSIGNRFLFLTMCNSTRIVQISPDFSFSAPTSYPAPFDVSENEEDQFLLTNYVRAEAEVIEMSSGNYRHARVVSLDPTWSGNPSDPNFFPYQMVEIKECSPIGKMLFPSSVSEGRERFYLAFFNGAELEQQKYYIKGIEFSASGEKIYVTTQQPPYLWYADLAQITSVSPYLNGNMSTVNSFFGLTPMAGGSDQMGQIEMGPDGKIYGIEEHFPLSGSTSMRTINDPENPTTTTTTSIFLGSYGGGIIWPSPIESIGHSDQISTVVDPRYNFILADQVDGEIPLQTVPDPDCCNASLTYFIVDEYVVQADETWSSTNTPWSDQILYENGGTIKSNIIVPTGKSLTIQDLTLKFAEGVKIIVEKGAKLNLKNSHLTSVDCPGIMWAGIEVHGSPSLSPSTTNQGVVVMSSGSKISNAVNGIANGKMTGDNTADWNTYGGRIYVSNSTFENNYRDLNYFPYTAFGYFGAISSTSFLTTAPIKDPNRQYKDHITCQYIKSLTINSSNFTDNVGVPSRTGINSMTANVIVKNSSFTGLYYGIYAASTNTTMSVKSQLNTFTGNRIGAYLRRVDFCQFTDNTIVIDETISTGEKAGFYFDHCSGYKVEDNNFTGISGIPTSSYGIVVVNSNSFSNIDDNNFIYRNTFTNIDLALVPMHKNIEGTNGLTIQCNTIEQSESADIFTFASTSVATDIGIKEWQGTCFFEDPTKPANNVFSTTSPMFGNFIQNPPAHFVIYIHPDGGGVYQTEPLVHTTNVAPFQCLTLAGDFSPSVYCPEHSFPGTGVLIGSIAVKKNQIENLNDQIDNGSTTALVAYINSNPANHLLSQTLIEATPYLSDEALIAMINRTPLVPDNIINNICKANAPLHDNVWLALINRSAALPGWGSEQIAAEHDLLSQTVQLALINRAVPLQANTLNTILLDNSPLTEEVLKAMLIRATPLPAWSINQVLGVNTPLSQDVEDAMYAHIPVLPNWVINQVNSSTFVAGEPQLFSLQFSPIDELLQQIGSLNAERDYEKGELIRYYIFNEDSTVNWLDSLKMVFESESDAKDICRLADVYVAKGDFTNALITYDAVLTMGVISMEDWIAHRKALVNGSIQIKGCDHLWTEPEMLQDIEELSLILDPKRSETDEARAILDFLYNDLKGEIFVVPELDNQNKSMASGGSDEETKLPAESTFVYLAPNPTNDGARVFVKGDANQISSILVFDIQGNVILGDRITPKGNYYFVETTDLANGIYLIHVILNDGSTEVLKLNVIH